MNDPEKQFRSFNGPSSSITARIADDGEALIRVSAGAVSIVISVPPEQVAFLFAAPCKPETRDQSEEA